MSPLIARTIRRFAFVGVLGATVFLGYEFIQNPDTARLIETVKTSKAVETAKTTAASSAQLIENQTGGAKKVWDDLDVDGKVNDLQDKTRPLGRKITQAVGPKINPSFQPVKEGERRMSLPALLLILVFGFVFIMMGRASSGGGRY